MRGGGDGEGGGVAREDGSLCGGPEGMPTGCRRSGGGVRLRLVSEEEYAGKVEKYCSWGQKRVEHLYWYWRQ